MSARDANTRGRTIVAFVAATIDAGILLATVVVFSILLASVSFGCTRRSDGIEVTVASGWLQLSHANSIPLLGSEPVLQSLLAVRRVWDHPAELRWNFVFDHDASGWLLNIPLWAPWVILGVPTFVRWRSRWRRRRSIGHCDRCGYDLSGSIAATPRCPECGVPVMLRPADHRKPP
jgi:hypothetical protein